MYIWIFVKTHLFFYAFELNVHTNKTLMSLKTDFLEILFQENLSLVFTSGRAEDKIFGNSDAGTCVHLLKAHSCLTLEEMMMLLHLSPETESYLGAAGRRLDGN